MTPQELKNSILQLAVQGKLVEQRLDEGTGEELFRKIKTVARSIIASNTATVLVRMMGLPLRTSCLTGRGGKRRTVAFLFPPVQVPNSFDLYKKVVLLSL